MDVTGQAFEDMQEQNIRLMQQLREKDDANFKLMSERIKSNQIHKLLKEEKEELADQLLTLKTQVVCVREFFGVVASLSVSTLHRGNLTPGRRSETSLSPLSTGAPRATPASEKCNVSGEGRTQIHTGSFAEDQHKRGCKGNTLFTINRNP